jgi:hypothetical protein
MQVMNLLITDPAVGLGIVAVPVFALLLARPMAPSGSGEATQSVAVCRPVKSLWIRNVCPAGVRRDGAWDSVRRQLIGWRR